MKRILFAGAFAIATMGLYSCDNQNTGTTATDADETLIQRDTVVSEMEVQETVVEHDTTTNTETVDVETQNNQNNQQQR